MKKLTTVIALVLMTLGAQAQMKGEYFISGALGFNTAMSNTKTGSIKSNVSSTTFSLMPEIGYFVDDNLSLNLGLGFENESVTVGNYTDGKKKFSVAPGVAYHLEIREGFFYSPGVKVATDFGKQYFDVNFALDFLAFEYRGWDRFGLFFNAGSLGFKVSSTKNDNVKSDSTSLYVDLGLATSFGFRFFI